MTGDLMNETDKNESQPNVPVSEENLYSLTGRIPFSSALLVAVQHVLAMFVSNITPVMILSNVCGLDASLSARLIQNAMIIAGISTLLVLFPFWRIGSRLPLILGVSFTYLNCSIAIAASYGLEGLTGAIIAGGFFLLILGLFAQKWVRYISPLIAGLVVMSIGISLLSVGATSFAGGEGAADFASAPHWIVGSVTLLTCLLFTALGKGFLKVVAILFALIAGYIVALFFGMVDFTPLHGTKIIMAPSLLPFKPVFHPGSILSILIFYLVTATEVIGNSNAVCDGTLNRPITPRELSGSLSAVGLGSIVAGLFGCMPVTTYGQNVGLVSMTKVVNRSAIALAALIMILSGIFPPFAVLLTTIPQSVLGGCTIMAFGSILAAGVQMLSKCGFSYRSWIIIAFSMSVGFGFAQCKGMFDIFPTFIQLLFGGNPVALVFFISLIMDLLLPKKLEG